jgi:hypothetical protein
MYLFVPVVSAQPALWAASFSIAPEESAAACPQFAARAKPRFAALAKPQMQEDAISAPLMAAAMPEAAAADLSLPAAAPAHSSRAL